MQLAAWTTGSDSIGWSSLPHDSRWCITPPPFGQQCTLLRPVAMAACLAMPRCVALTCPDPAESQIGRKVGVTGPICQARSVRTANEKRHGMCRPGGCTNIILRRRSPAGALREQSLVAQGMQSDARAGAWRAFAAFANASRAGDTARAAPASRVAGGELELEFASGEAGGNTALRDSSGHRLPGGGWDSAARGRRPAHKRAGPRGAAPQLHVIRPRPPDKGLRERGPCCRRMARVRLCGLVSK